MKGLMGSRPLPAGGTNTCQPATRAAGKRATIPTVMTSEMPFPIPFSVTCSPIHINSIVPAVRVITVMARKAIPGSGTKGPNFWIT